MNRLRSLFREGLTGDETLDRLQTAMGLDSFDERRHMKGFIKQKIVVEIECETQFADAEQLVRSCLQFPSIKSVKVLSCSGPKPGQIPNPEDVVDGVHANYK